MKHLSEDPSQYMSELFDEIHGFFSPGEYKRFVEYIEDLVKTGNLVEVVPNPARHDHLPQNEPHRWFRVKGTGELWRLVPPDVPFKGLWEKLNV